MENSKTFKEQYNIGLDLLKKDISSCENNKLYSPMTHALTELILDPAFVAYSLAVSFY